MSTNFYLETKGEKIHIGKRCGAGLYCHKCSEDRICWGDNDQRLGGKSKAYCPQCGDHILDTTCSFTWAMEPHMLGFTLSYDKAALIYDEYDQSIPVDNFYPMLRDMCRIQLYDSIGEEFS